MNLNLFLLSILIFILITQLQLILHPFTKVEESFNLHGIYDYLFQSSWSTWAHEGDHLTFTGPIPRTFLGSIIIGLISSPLISILKTLGVLKSKYGQQLIVRSILAIVNSSSIAYFGLCTRYVFGNSIGMMTIILSSLQFHLPFYSSRTLPNMFAFSLVQAALGHLVVALRRSSPSFVRRRLLRCGSLLSLAAVIFRLELLALLFPITLISLISRSVSIWEVFTRGFLVVFAALEVTVPLDSYFWQKFTWPEGSSVFFNVIQGHSSDWGVMPWHEYFTRSLPKLLGLCYPIGLIGFIIDRKTSFLGINCLIFISLMSFLKHKEWRFIVYVIPIFNLSTSVCLTKIGMMCPSIKNLRWYLFTIICAMTIAQTMFTSYISYYNYPGGRALVDLHSIPVLANHTNLRVYIDDLAAQSGASRFMQLEDKDAGSHSRNWTYSKLYDDQKRFDEEFEIIITENDEFLGRESFEILSYTKAFERIRFGTPQYFQVVFNHKRLITFGKRSILK